MVRGRAISYYDQHAAELADSYETIPFEQAYPFLVPLFSDGSLDVLDIGAGTGRDAAWIAARGHRVCAVEPSAAMRTLAKKLHPNQRITWIDARLPDLTSDVLQAKIFDVVLANAVWMHIPPQFREKSMRRIFELAKVGGKAFISLRIGPQDQQRGMYQVSPEGFRNVAQSVGFKVIPKGQQPDILGRSEISWLMYELAK